CCRLCRQHRRAVHRDHCDLTADQLSRHFRQSIVLTFRPAVLNDHVLPLDIAGVFEPLAECARRDSVPIGRGAVEKPNHRHWLLRACSERPRSPAPEKRDELPPSHSITSSARASIAGGMVRPSALAVFGLISSSYLDACSTGRSAGSAPLRILST